ncbi:hypothetical protein GCM10009839_29160 [Catenulispora yoronensis]|uniref:Secreted protein n=1 Tax=Catenulispora yoronensis TaxID=450799 RepID=A0ABN2U5K7_9ACTN
MPVVTEIFIGFLVVLGAAGAVAAARRNRALTALAAVKQWDLTKNDREIPDTFGGPPFTIGHKRVARRVLRGSHSGRAVLVLDYEYRTPGSDGDDTHHAWVACVDDLPVALPALEVVARSGRRELSSRSGGQLAMPEFVIGDPAFDRRYHVYAANLQLAADLLGPQVLRLIASWPDFSWRVEGTRLLTWGSGTLKPHWIETNLNMLVSLVEAVPERVWQTARG